MILRFGDCELDLARVVLRREGHEVRIEPQVFDLLHCLIGHRGEVVHKETLLDEVWGTRFVSESALTTRIKMVRQAVGDDGAGQRVIRTVHGKGYEFVAAVQVVEDAVAVDREAGREVQAGRPLLASLQSLIGREEALTALIEAQAVSRLITLVGPGGVGKTSLGYELVRRIASDYTDGVFVVELVTVADHDATSAAFATALEVNTRQQSSIEEAIVDVLRPRHVLLLVDNCEHLIESVAALVDRLLRAAPRLSIVATSREPLAVSGELVRAVDPLPIDGLDDVSLDELPLLPAIALFLDRVSAADARFELDAATAPAVIEICRRLDGIPLAIELAASRASAIDVTEVAHRLDERFRLLKGVRRGSDPRHQTLQGAISWSYELLDADEQRLFAELAVFAGPFDLGAAESICADEDVVDLLARLTRRSMLAVRRPERGGTRYELLETLREFGRGRLGDQESADLFSAHVRHFLAVAGSVERDQRTAREPDAVARADRSFADLRAAHRFAQQIEDHDTAFGLVARLREYAMRTLRYEVFAWANSTATAATTEHPLYPTVTGVRAYGAWVRGEFELAIGLAESARLAEAAAGLVPSGLAERVLANVWYTTGKVESALLESAMLIELAEDSRDGSRLAHACYMASVAASWIGDYDDAHRLIGRSRQAGLGTGSPTDLASASVAEGFATVDDDDAALAAFATADRLAQSAGNRWMSAFARTEASGLLVAKGQLAEGCESLAEMVDTWYRAGEWAQQWHTLSRCVIALDRIGCQEMAVQVLGAIESHTTMGGPPVMTTLRDLAFETRDSLAERLGDELAWQQREIGASLPVAVLVDRTRNALLGRPLDG